MVDTTSTKPPIMDALESRLNRLLSIVESKQDSRILSQLSDSCRQLDIPATIIGGMAVAAHGYPRFTADIDILIKPANAQKLANHLLQAGWIDVGSNKLQDRITGILLNLCAEGVKAGKFTFPPPTNDKPGINIASLPLLLALKIKANRYKDRSDVVELIKANNISKDYLVDNVFTSLSSIAQKTLLTLLRAAEKESK